MHLIHAALDHGVWLRMEVGEVWLPVGGYKVTEVEKYTAEKAFVYV